MRIRNKGVGLVLAGLMLCARGDVLFAVEGEAVSSVHQRGNTLFMVSPLMGVNRNEMKVRGPRGEMETKTETALEYGIFALLKYHNFILTDFLFYTEVNDTDVSGNLFFANYYASRERRLSWNVGAGHLYHKIKPSNQDITVSVPMVKAGPLVNIPEWNLSINPYIGYAWERIDTAHGDQDNDSYMYGITVGWRWRMLAATVKYYYQDSQESDDDYHTVRARTYGMFNEHWGAVIRFDYMEHSTSDDTSVLAGPVFVF
ncbi:MAG: hypothetical protein EOM20_08670 [Spartobacteria bacterium]|nr:hypothetical protein [Spartobacteria bacterium]